MDGQRNESRQISDIHSRPVVPRTVVFETLGIRTCDRPTFTITQVNFDFANRLQSHLLCEILISETISITI